MDARTSRIAKIGLLIPKLLACGVLVYFGLEAISGIRYLTSSKPASESVAHPASAAAVNPIHPLSELSITKPGYWSFAGWNWEAAAGSDSQLDGLPELRRSEVGIPIARANEPDDSRLFELLEQLQANVEPEAGVHVHSVELGSANITVRELRSNGQRWIAGVSIRFPGEDPSGGRFVSLRRKDPAGEGSPFLLPLPNGATRVGSRHDDSGRLQSEIVQGCHLHSRLVASWRDRGYSVTRSDLSQFNAIGYLCERQGSTILAWSPEGPDPVGVLLLARVDEP